MLFEGLYYHSLIMSFQVPEYRNGLDGCAEGITLV